MESFYHISSSTTAFTIGPITVISGILGTATGTLILNKLMKKYDAMMNEGIIRNKVLEKYRLEMSCKMMPIGIFLGMVAATGAMLFSVFFFRTLGFSILYYRNRSGRVFNLHHNFTYLNGYYEQCSQTS